LSRLNNGNCWPRQSLAVKDNSRDLGYAIGPAFEKMRTSGELQQIFSNYGVTYVSPD
jgi:hypothetical protein